MGWIEIDAVEVLPCKARLRHVHCDFPQPGRQPFACSLDFAGWMVPESVPPVGLVFSLGTTEVHQGPANLARPDVTEHLRRHTDWPPTLIEAAGRAGFHTGINAVGFPPVFELLATVLFADGTRAPLAVVRGRRQPPQWETQPLFQPIILEHLGRSGSTLFMQYLSRHPGIVAVPRYPFEACAASHAARLVAALATPCPAPRNPEIFALATSHTTVGPLPFCCEIEAPPLHAWLHDPQARLIAKFAVDTLNAFYREAARGCAKAGCRCFAEKFFVRTRLAAILAEICPGTREIILVRDFRDVLCSQVPDTPSEEIPLPDKLAWVAKYAALLIERKQRLGRAALVVRYENLVQRPAPVLRELFEKLGLEHGPTLLRSIVEIRPGDEELRRRYASSPGVLESVGRWKRDLTPQQQALCTDVLASALREFGYLPEPAA